MVGQQLGANWPELAARATAASFWIAMAYTDAIASPHCSSPGLFSQQTRPSHAPPNRPLAGHGRHPVALFFVAAYSLFDAMKITFCGAIKGAGPARAVHSRRPHPGAHAHCAGCGGLVVAAGGGLSRVLGRAHRLDLRPGGDLSRATPKAAGGRCGSSSRQRLSATTPCRASRPSPSTGRGWRRRRAGEEGDGLAGDKVTPSRAFAMRWPSLGPRRKQRGDRPQMSSRGRRE